MSSEPVFVVIMSNRCQHCIHLLNQWPEVIQSVLSIYPKMRFPQSDPTNVHTKHLLNPPIMIIDGVIDSYMYPRDLRKYYDLWTPITLLIPGKVWDDCHKKLGPGNMEKMEPVQIMNSKPHDGTYLPFQTHDTRIAVNFGLWVQEALKNMSHVGFDRFDIRSMNIKPLVEKVNEKSKTKKSKRHVCENILNLIGSSI